MGDKDDLLPVDKQNNKFAISLQYLNQNVKDEVDPLFADKQRFLQIDTIPGLSF